MQRLAAFHAAFRLKKKS